jgi:pectate lyase
VVALFRREPGALGIEAVFTDDFNRADQSVSVSANWGSITSMSSLSIVSNTVSNAGTNTTRGNRVVTGTWPDNQYAQLVVLAVNEGSGSRVANVGVRAASAAQSWYHFGLNPSGWVLIRRDAGISTTLASSEFTVSLPHTIRIEAVGSSIRGYIDGVLVANATDSTYPSGNPVMYIFRSSSSIQEDVILDDFEAGTLSPPLRPINVYRASGKPVKVLPRVP